MSRTPIDSVLKRRGRPESWAIATLQEAVTVFHLNEVNLTKRIRTSTGLRYCPVVLSANGRVKPDAVLVNGKPERHPEGAYYIEWHDNGKRIRLSVGKDAADASAMRLRKETELNNGDATVPETASNGHRSLIAAVTELP